MSSSEHRAVSAAAPDEPAAAAPPAAPDEPAAAAPPVMASVSQWVAALDTAAARPLVEHVGLYQRLHSDLQAALVQIEGV